MKKYPKLIASASSNRYFGSWGNAIKAAGLDYSKIKVREFTEIKWTKERVVNEILDLKKNCVDLNAKYIFDKYNNLYSAAERHFGGWGYAINASGLDYPKIMKVEKWSKQKIFGNLKKLKDDGKELSFQYSRKNYPTLVYAAIRRYGSWEQALNEIGLNYDDILKLEKWDRKKVRTELNTLIENGEDLNSVYISKKYSGLFHACSRYYGSLENALISLGIDYDKIRKDRYQESFKGLIFEKYVKQIFEIIGRKVAYHPPIEFEGVIYYPDFIDKTGTIIDCKLNSWGGRIEETIDKYLKFDKNIIIIYLLGEPRKWYNEFVVFKWVKDYYPQLKKIGKEDIIYDLSLLENGVIPNKDQKKLDEYPTISIIDNNNSNGHKIKL